MSFGKPVIKFCVMEDEMRDYAVSEATKSLELPGNEQVSINIRQILNFYVQQMASYMKKTFEKKYKSVWHCIVGKSSPF